MSARHRISFAKPSPCGIRVAPPTRIRTPQGSRHFRLEVLGIPFYAQLGARPHSVQLVVCKCDCGKVIAAATSGIVSTAIRSCGCLGLEKSAAQGRANTTHGCGHRATPEYRAWQGMRSRVYQKDHLKFRYVGGKGIKICERWSRFENFLADMGLRPATDFVLDRLDRDGDFTPDNCRWARRRLPYGRIPPAPLRTAEQMAALIAECRSEIENHPGLEPVAMNPEGSRASIPPIVVDGLPPLPVIDGVEVRHLPGFRGYAVADDGSAFSCRTRRPRGLGHGSVPAIASDWHRITPSRTGSYGYLSLGMQTDSGGRRVEKLYRAILRAFVGDCPEGFVACHCNGDPSDNRLANLRWDTVKNNHADKRVHGTLRVGEYVYNASLTDDDARLIKALIAKGCRNNEIAKAMNVLSRVIEGIRAGKTWKRV